MMAPLAEHVLTLLLDGKLTRSQQKAHAQSLLENDEYFEMFFASVELAAVSILRQREKRGRIDNARNKTPCDVDNR